MTEYSLLSVHCHTIYYTIIGILGVLFRLSRDFKEDFQLRLIFVQELLFRTGIVPETTSETVYFLRLQEYKVYITSDWFP